MKKLYALLLVLMCSMNAFATDFYWVGGNGNWSDFQHHWALSSGGSVFQTTVPSAFDNVFFDANSFPGTNDTMVTINIAVATTKNITFNIGQKNARLYFNTNTLIQVYGSAIFSDNLLLLNNPRIFFKSTALGNQLTFNKSKWTNTTLTFDGIGGAWEVTDSLTAAQSIFLINGELNTNNKKVTCSGFESTNSNVRTWKYSNAKLNIQNLNITTTNLTQVYAASSIRVSRLYNNGATKFNVDTVYNHATDQYGNYLRNVLFHTAFVKSIGLDNSSAVFIYATNGGAALENSTVSKLYITNGGLTIHEGTSVINEAYLDNISAIQISGLIELQSFTLTGNTCAKRIRWTGDTNGILRKTSGTFVFEYALITNLTAAGGASFTTSNSYDLGGNSGINFTNPASKTYYWVGDNGDVDDPLHWSLTSGGASEGCIPTVYDDVILDRNSFNSGTSHGFNSISCRSIYATDLDEQVTVGAMLIKGSAYLSPLLRSPQTISFSTALTGNEIDLNGAIIKGEFSKIIFSGTGDWILKDSLYAYTIEQRGGSLFSDGWNIHASGLSQSGGNADFSHSTLVIDNGIYSNAILNTSKIIFPSGGTLYTQQQAGEVISNSGKLIALAANARRVTSLGDLQIQAYNKIDTLFIKQGSDVSFSLFYDSQLEVDSIGILPSNLGCGALTIFQTTEILNYTYGVIKKSSGTLILKDVALTNIHAEGGASFIANQSADLGNNNGWTFSALVPKTYYWVNNGGQWEDASHWSLSSGGPSAGCIPAVLDKVILDHNSFDAPNQLISKTKPEVQLSSFVAQNIPPGTALAINKFEIFGNVEMTKNLVTPYVYLYLKGVKSTLKTNGKYIDYVNCLADTMELLDDLSCLGFSATKGSVKLRGRNIVAQGIGFDGSSSDTLIVDMEECTITAESFSANLDNLNLKAGESTITIPVGKFFDPAIFKIHCFDCLESNRLHLNKVTVYQNTAMPQIPFLDISISNTVIDHFQIDTTELSVLFNLQGEIKNLYMKPNCVLSASKIGVAQFYGNVQIYGSTEIDYLRLEPGTQFSISSGAYVTVNEYLNAVGTSSSPITIDALTNGSKAYIKCLTGDICCSYLNLSNIGAVGGANFYAGLSSNNIFNNTGWNFASNCDILNIESKIPGCEGKELVISAVHPSNVTGFLWSGPNGFTSNAETISIPSLSAEQTGLYTLIAGGQTRKMLITQETKQDSVILNYQNGSIGLRSTIIDPMKNYVISWYKDDQLIDAEFTNTIYTSGDGSYYARYTSPAGCDFQSNTLIIESTPPTDFLYAPYNLLASLNSQGKGSLTWNDINTNKNGFKIFRSTSPSSGFVSIGNTGQSTYSYTDPTTLAAGTYYYKVLTYLDALESDFSNTANIVVTVLGVQQTSRQNNISIRPIPVEDILTIESPDLLLTQVSVYDQLGVIHVSENVEQTSALQLDLKILPQGVYILKVTTTEGESYRRFIK